MNKDGATNYGHQSRNTSAGSRKTSIKAAIHDDFHESANAFNNEDHPPSSSPSNPDKSLPTARFNEENTFEATIRGERIKSIIIFHNVMYFHFHAATF